MVTLYPIPSLYCPYLPRVPCMLFTIHSRLSWLENSKVLQLILVNAILNRVYDFWKICMKTKPCMILCCGINYWLWIYFFEFFKMMFYLSKLHIQVLRFTIKVKNSTSRYSKMCEIKVAQNGRYTDKTNLVCVIKWIIKTAVAKNI